MASPGVPEFPPLSYPCPLLFHLYLDFFFFTLCKCCHLFTLLITVFLCNNQIAIWSKSANSKKPFPSEEVTLVIFVFFPLSFNFTNPTGLPPSSTTDTFPLSVSAGVAVGTDIRV